MTQEKRFSPAGEIVRKVREFLERRSGVFMQAAVADDGALFTSGVLDSMTFVLLVAFIEREFKVRLSRGGALNFARLDTLLAIEKEVRAQLESPNP